MSSIVNVLFYQDSNSEDCDVFGMYSSKKDAIKYLKDHGWCFDIYYCIWQHKDYRGFIEMIERKLD